MGLYLNLLTNQVLGNLYVCILVQVPEKDECLGASQLSEKPNQPSLLITLFNLVVIVIIIAIVIIIVIIIVVIVKIIFIIIITIIIIVHIQEKISPK